MKDRLWTVQDCAEFLGVQPDWVYRAIKRHDLPHIKIGRIYRFDQDDVPVAPGQLLDVFIESAGAAGAPDEPATAAPAADGN